MTTSRAAPAAQPARDVGVSDSAAAVRRARIALARQFRLLGERLPRYRVLGLTPDSVGVTVSFTSCRVVPCIDGGARVRVRPDGRAEVLAIR